MTDLQKRTPSDRIEIKGLAEVNFVQDAMPKTTGSNLNILLTFSFSCKAL
ncbi:MAG: hypothetical protein KME11_15340 [Timaviella obliquedivisa GSE-PSE-MK23-08B]|jgi:hypothetical protein|nr:hypothetical protein [Timaviella obliquedivisa GSE-PSE-MK23-08B]